MKKSIIASVMALGLVGASAAQAANNEVTFVGAVTSTTCDVSTSVSGAASTNSVVQLGSVSVGQEGTAVPFAIKATNPSDPACAALTQQQTATVHWSSANLTADGFGATSGVAQDAVALVNAVNAKNANTAINATTNTVDFTADKVTSADGLQFEAKLKGGNTEGDFKSVAVFAMSYK
ncbi:fimbrial protein [Yersinia enterocolitica]|uniref:fimbrial protein n=1 Tax=Yersinia enterocolitica TaxID=630 RepID=UPI0029B77981|nr:fimbrial protein [Yersinia enterocolitica]